MKEEEIIFRERQNFRQWWLWLPFLLVNLLFFYGMYKQVLLGEQFGDKPMSNNGLMIASGVTLLVSLLFLTSRLETRITAEGIYVRFFPFHRSFKHYAWSRVTKSYVRKYQPLTEFGGWGLRWGSSGQAYNVSGNKGLQLEIDNKKKLLIGT